MYTLSIKIRVTFSKRQDMKLVSHLDLMRLFQRASRRAGLPIYMTKGFNPHPKISITRALRLGIESKSEGAIFYLDKWLEPEEVKNRLNEQLPDGVEILDAKTDPD